jgi:hypothetical protein
MKFTLKNLEVEIDGWKAEFKQIKSGAYIAYMMRSDLIDREKLKNNDGEMSIDTNQFTTSQLADFMELEELFLVEQLVTATDGTETVKTEDQKGLFVNWLLTQDEFTTWKDGYINGPKKT